MRELTLRILDEKTQVLVVAETDRGVLLVGGQSRMWAPKDAISLSTGHVERWYVGVAEAKLRQLFDHPITDDNVTEIKAGVLLERRRHIRAMRRKAADTLCSNGRHEENDSVGGADSGDRCDTVFD